MSQKIERKKEVRSVNNLVAGFLTHAFIPCNSEVKQQDEVRL